MLQVRIRALQQDGKAGVAASRVGVIVIQLQMRTRKGRIRRMNDNMDIKIIKNYEIIKKVGKGAYGQVWKCVNKKSKQPCALKRIFEAFRNVTDCQRTYRQIMYLKQLSHPNIIKLYHYEKSYNERDMYLEMEYVESDLATALKNQYLKDLQKQYIFLQLVAAVYYLHSGNLMHRDIKPSNVLVGVNCEAKLCDFGLIRTISNQKEDGKLTDNIATRWYKAPELLLSSCNYGKEIDVWSLGCLLGELYLGKPIFQGSSTFNQLEKIIKITGIPNIDRISEIIQSETSIAVLKSFINDYPPQSQKQQKRESITALNLNSTKSKSTSSLAEYQGSVCNSLPENYAQFYQLIPALRDASNTFGLAPSTSNTRHVVDLLSKLLQFDPRKRIKVEQIIDHPYCSRFRSKVEWRSMQKIVRVRFDNMKLSVDDYKLLLGNEIKNNPELSVGLHNRSSPEREKVSKSIDRPKENPRNSIYTPTQSPKVCPSPINTGNTIVNNNFSVSKCNSNDGDIKNSGNTKASANSKSVRENKKHGVDERGMSNDMNPNSNAGEMGNAGVGSQVSREPESATLNPVQKYWTRPPKHITLPNSNSPNSMTSMNTSIKTNTINTQANTNNANININRNTDNNANLNNKNRNVGMVGKTGASYVSKVEVVEGVQKKEGDRYIVTTYINTNYPRTSTRNYDKNEDKERSEKSYSINKSDNKSISALSNKSYRSNISACNNNNNINNNNSNNMNKINNNNNSNNMNNMSSINNNNKTNNMNNINNVSGRINGNQNDNNGKKGGIKPREMGINSAGENNLTITNSYSMNANNRVSEPPTDKFNYRQSIDKKLRYVDQIRTNYYQHPNHLHQDNIINSVSSMSSINSANSANSSVDKENPNDPTTHNNHNHNNLIIYPSPDAHYIGHQPTNFQNFSRHSAVSSPYNSPTTPNIPRSSFPSPVFVSTPSHILPSHTYITQYTNIYPNTYIGTNVSIHSPTNKTGGMGSGFSTVVINHGKMGEGGCQRGTN